MKFYDHNSVPKHNRIDPVPIPRAELVKWIKSEKWYQTIDFGGGLITPGFFDSGDHIDKVLIDKKMTGKRYLDIGSNQGHQVMSAAMRGAKAFGIDNEKNQVLKANRIAAHFGIKVDIRLMDVFNVQEEYSEYEKGFDYITLMSVFHHFRKPKLALRLVRGMCKGKLMAEFCCWVPGEKRWLRAFKFPEDWREFYHKAYPTVDCCVKELETLFSKVTVLGPVKAKHRIAILSEI